MTSITSFAGLASGLDTAKIVTGLVAAEQAPIDALKQTKANFGSMSVRLAGISAKLDALGAAATSLATPGALATATATSSDATAVGVVAGAGTAVGTYAVSVTSLARAQRTYSSAFASDTATGTLGAGTLSIAVGAGAPASIAIGASDSLATVASKINASGLDVTAATVFDGTHYRLQVSGNTPGAANAIGFTESGTTLGLDDPGHVAQAASDAAFSIDGMAMTRGSNTVTGAIPGVTLSLTKITANPVVVEVATSGDALAGKVKAFVDAFNAVSKSIDAESTYNGSARVGDSLAGDFTLRGLQGRLRSQALGGGALTTDRLTSVGITFGRDGTLSFDAAKFASAMAADAPGVARVLAGDGTHPGVMAGFTKLDSEYTRAKDGLLSMRRDSFATRIRDVDDRITKMQSRLDAYEQGLKSRFAAMETMISALQSQGSQLSSFVAASNR